MKNLNLHKALFLAVFLLVSSYTFSNSVEKSSSTAKLAIVSLAGPISTIVPSSGHAGTVVTITDIGGSFVPTDAALVTLAGNPVAAVFIDSNTIVATIPCGASSGSFSVNGGTPSAPFTYFAPTITSSLPNLAYCNGFSVPAIPLSGTPIAPTVGVLTYTWTSSNPAIGLASGSGAGIPSFTAVNTTTAPITSTITITPEISGCVGLVPLSYDITVNPTPNVSALGFPLTPICDGTIVGSVTLNSTVIGTTYTWTGDSNAAAIGFSPISGSGSPIPSFTATNTTNATISATFTVTPSSNGCVGTPQAYTISVLPASVGGTATASTSQICMGGSTTISLAGYTPGASIQWQSATSGTYANVPGGTTATLSVPSLLVTTSYRAIVTSGTCTPALSTVANVIVDPVTVAGTVSPAVSTICSGNTTSFTLSGNVGSIQWQSDASGSFANMPGETNPILNTPILTSTTSYRAIVKSGVCASLTTAAVIVNVDPVSFGGTVTGGTTICLGSPSPLLSLTGETGTVVKWQSAIAPFSTWTDISNTTTSYTPPIGLAQTTQFRAVVQSGVCITANSAPTTVTIDPISVGGTATAATPTICTGGSTTITLTGNTGSIQWQTDASGLFVDIPFENNASFTTPLLTATTSYRARITSGVCTTVNSTTATVTVNALPTVTVNSATICSGTMVAVTATPVPAGSYTYSWTVPSGVTPPGNVASFPTTIAGDYTVVVTETAVPNCSSLPATGTVTVNPLPTAVISGTNSVCLGTSTIITFIGSLGKAPYTFSYNVNGGATQTAISAGTGNSISIVVPTPTAGVFNYNLVSVTDSNLPTCTKPIVGQTATITVNPIPNLFITDPLDICQGGTADLTAGAITTGSDPGTLTYWINATATIQYTTPASATAGTYYIKLDDGTSCPSIKPVKVTAVPLPSVSVNSQTICADGTATITATPNPPGLYTYSWIGLPVGVPNPGDTPSFSTNIAGDYVVEITNLSLPLCVSPSATGKVTVNPLPMATITSSAATVCIGSTASITFVGSLGTAPYTYVYTINGGATQSIVSMGNSITIPVPTSIVGVFNYNLVSVTDSSSTICTQPVTGATTITVRPLPTVSAGLDVTVCVGEPITLTGSGTASTYTWSNGIQDGVPFNPIITATYTVTGTDMFGCVSTDTVLVTVIPQIQATIKSPNDFKVCRNASPPDIVFVGSGGTAPYTFDYEITSSLLAAPITGSITSSLPNGEVTLTPNIPTTTAGTFTIKLLNVMDAGFCTTGNLIDPKEGYITVFESTVNLVTGSATQTVCLNNPMLPIAFSINSTPVTTPPAFLVLVGSLPTGVTFSSTTGMISGTATQGGVFPYSIVSSTGCGTPISGQISVDTAVPNVLIEGGLPKIDACKGSTISLTATGADNYLWYKLDALGNQSPLGTGSVYSYSPTIEETIFVLGKIIGGCANIAKIDVNLIEAITATITGVNTIEVCKNNSSPTITFTASNGTAPYTFTYTINSLTNTVVSAGGNSAVISIPTNVAGVFDIKLVDVKDALGSIYCNPSKLVEPTTAKVTVFESSITPQTPGTLFQTVCETTPIQDILFDISGGPSNAYVLGLPLGILQNYSSGVLTISGTPIESGIFNYTVYTSGSLVPCNTTFSGTITVTPNQTIQLLTTGKDNQQICPGASIEPISYELGASVSGVTVAFTPKTPAGISWNKSGSTLIFSGATNDTPGVYNYTITTQGACASTTATGSITIIQTNTLVLTNGNQNEELCMNTALTPIQYTGNPGQTLVLNGLLPPGVVFNADPVSGSATITGTPTLFGNYLYSITTNNSCGDKLDGSIIVNNNDFINYVSGGLNQIACIGSPIEPIRYAVPLKVVNANITISPSLPSGLSYFVNNGQLVIAGTPTAISTVTSYEVSVIKCGTPVKSSFKLEILETPIITLEADSGSLAQSVCQNGQIIPIKFKLGGAATGIDQSILPGFISSTYDAVTGIYTLTGAPQTAGVFTFDIKTTGVSSCSTTLSVSISNLYAALSINLAPGSGKDNQIICGFNPITTIVYNVVGTVTTADIKVNGLPTGITSSNLATTTGITVTISGTSTIAGIFDYALVYKTCTEPVLTGKISISSPISVTAKITPISCGGSDGSIAVTIFGGTPFVNSAGTPYYSIIWTGPNGYSQNQTTITGLAAGDYTLTGIDALGCPIPTRTYTIAPSLPINITLISKTGMSCEGSLGCANFNYTGGTGIYTSFLLQYLDPSSQTLKTIIPPNNNYYNICNLKAGLYYLTVTDSNNCKTAPYLFTIEDYSTLTIKSISLDSQLCSNSPGKMRIVVNSLDTNLKFFYNSAPVTSTALGNGTYDLLINSPTTPSGVVTVNSQSCSVSSTVNTTVLTPDFEFTSHDFENTGFFTVNSSIEFKNLMNIATIPQDSRVEWDFGDKTPVKVLYYPKDMVANAAGDSFLKAFHSYRIDGFYEVTFTFFNSSGCSQSITKTITIGSGASMVLPTAFSPNNDGINDLFRPSIVGLKEVSMYVYDEWGNLVYEVSSDVASLTSDWGWNGIEKVNSEPKNGTYRYYINAKANDNKILEKEGRVMLIK